MTVHGNRPFDHILIIMFENQYRSYVMQNPYFRRLSQRGLNMTNYFGCMHPSQTNYIASIAGELCNVTDDKQPAPLLQNNIVDLIEDSPQNLSWRAYMDSYIAADTPWTPDLVPRDHYPYVIKHNPFSSFKNIITNQERWKKIDNEAGFWSDLLNGTFPNYAWFTPDMWNDGHYLDGTQTDPEERAPALVDQAAKWLEDFFGRLRFPGPNSHLPDNTLVVVTFDEADYEKKYDTIQFKYTYDGPNQIYTVLLGDELQPGRIEEGFNHYSLLRTIEKNFELDDLGKNDRHANWFRFLWGERFRWNTPKPTPLHVEAGLASAWYGGVLFTVTADHDGSLYQRTADGYFWSEAQELPFKGHAPALAVSGANLILIAKDDEGKLFQSTYTLADGWSQPDTLTIADVAQYGLTAFGEGRLMLVTNEGDNGQMVSRVFDGAAWQSPVDVGFAATGAILVTAIGPSLYLIFRQVDGCMQVVSYNTADFNTVQYPKGSEYAGLYDDTVAHAWCKSTFPVARFGHAPSPKTQGEPEPLLRPYHAGESLAAAAMDGVIYLVHPGVNNSQLLYETFSISGLMTPQKPISYQTKDMVTTSNGYGTLAQAGWSRQEPIPGLFGTGPMTLTPTPDGLVLLYADAVSGDIQLVFGAWERS